MQCVSKYLLQYNAHQHVGIVYNTHIALDAVVVSHGIADTTGNRHPAGVHRDDADPS